jgi:hypothetical protein
VLPVLVLGRGEAVEAEDVMQTKPEEVVVYLETTATGLSLVIDRGGMSPQRILLKDLSAKVLGAKFYILVGNAAGMAASSPTPPTRPVFKP